MRLSVGSSHIALLLLMSGHAWAGTINRGPTAEGSADSAATSGSDTSSSANNGTAAAATPAAATATTNNGTSCSSNNNAASATTPNSTTGSMNATASSDNATDHNIATRETIEGYQVSTNCLTVVAINISPDICSRLSQAEVVKTNARASKAWAIEVLKARYGPEWRGTSNQRLIRRELAKLEQELLRVPGKCWFDYQKDQMWPGTGCECMAIKETCQAGRDTCAWYEDDSGRRKCVSKAEHFYNKLADLLSKRDKDTFSVNLKYSSAGLTPTIEEAQVDQPKPSSQPTSQTRGNKAGSVADGYDDHDEANAADGLDGASNEEDGGGGASIEGAYAVGGGIVWHKGQGRQGGGDRNRPQAGGRNKNTGNSKWQTRGRNQEVDNNLPDWDSFASGWLVDHGQTRQSSARDQHWTSSGGQRRRTQERWQAGGNRWEGDDGRFVDREGEWEEDYYSLDDDDEADHMSDGDSYYDGDDRGNWKDDDSWFTGGGDSGNTGWGERRTGWNDDGWENRADSNRNSIRDHESSWGSGSGDSWASGPGSGWESGGSRIEKFRGDDNWEYEGSWDTGDSGSHSRGDSWEHGGTRSSDRTAGNSWDNVGGNRGGDSWDHDGGWDDAEVDSVMGGDDRFEQVVGRRENDDWDHDSTRWNDDVGGSSWEAGGGNSWDHGSDRWDDNVGGGNGWDHGSDRRNDDVGGGNSWVVGDVNSFGHGSDRWNDDAGGGDSWDRGSDRWNNDVGGDNSWAVGEGNSWAHGSHRWNDDLIGGDRWNDDFGYNDAADILSDGINTLANVFGLSSRRNQDASGWHARNSNEGNFYRMNDDEDWASPSSSERRRQSGDIGAWEREPTSWKPRRRRPGQEPLFRQRRAAKEQSENSTSSTSSASSESSTDGSGTTADSSGGGKRKRRGTNV